jgi:O-antigen/teichoic acid export membrane protein
MTLWQRFVQGMTAFSPNTAISVAAGLFQARLVFFYLSPADYGQLNVYLSFFATGAVFLGLGLGRVFTSEVARARGAGEYGLARSLITRYSLLASASGIVLLLVFVGIGLWRDDVVM